MKKILITVIAFILFTSLAETISLDDFYKKAFGGSTSSASKIYSANLFINSKEHD